MEDDSTRCVPVSLERPKGVKIECIHGRFSEEVSVAELVRRADRKEKEAVSLRDYRLISNTALEIRRYVGPLFSDHRSQCRDAWFRPNPSAARGSASDSFVVSRFRAT